MFYFEIKLKNAQKQLGNSDVLKTVRTINRARFVRVFSILLNLRCVAVNLRCQ